MSRDRLARLVRARSIYFKVAANMTPTYTLVGLTSAKLTLLSMHPRVTRDFLNLNNHNGRRHARQPSTREAAD